MNVRKGCIMKFTKSAPLWGEITVPGDKSISHRAVMLGSLAEGTTEVTNFLKGADCISTIRAFQAMGIDIEEKKDTLLIHGKGLHGLQAPKETLDMGNSGTTTRLLSGILAGQAFEATLTGDDSLKKRPMNRIITPLSQMGAQIESLPGNGCLPLRITGSSLKGIHYETPMKSAQVKSAVLLAGLYADGPTSVTESALTRNHTELMLRYFGAEITTEGTTSTIQPEPHLIGQKVEVPGDISSAAYFIAAALLVPDSQVLIRNVGVNHSRDGILRAVHAMGGDIRLLNRRKEHAEPVADILVKSGPLKAAVIGGDLIPALIDEIPVLAVLACFAEGTTVIKDAQELKVKESNRIDTVVSNLKAMGAHVEATDDGMIIEGGHPLHGALIHSHLDHRIAMSFAIAGLAAEGETEIKHAECVNISYPGFYEDLKSLQMEEE